MLRPFTGLLAGAMTVTALAACSQTAPDTSGTPTSASSQSSVTVLTPSAIKSEPSAVEAAPPFSATPSRERVIACRAAERAFASSPEAIIIYENGRTSRVPARKEVAAYEKAMYAARDLSFTEPELQEMSDYFFRRVMLLRSAAAKNRELVKKAVEMNAPNGNLSGDAQSPVGFGKGALLDDACAAVGSVTSFE